MASLLLATSIVAVIGPGCAPRRSVVEPLERVEEAPASPSPPPAPQAEVPPLDRAVALLEKAGLTRGSFVDADEAARARGVGLTEEVIVDLLEQLLTECLATRGRCEEFRLPSKNRDERRRRTLDTLLGLLGELGSTQTLPLLLRLDARGLYRAGMARDALMTRLMLKAVAAYPCTLPSTDDVEAARRRLEGFAVFEVKGKALAARRPSSKELDDLAYFMASVRDAGGEVGRSTEKGDGAWYRPGPTNLTREQLLEQLEAAMLDGQLETVAELARAYLQTLGYPGELQTETAHEYTWGGARYSYVMRDLAETLESLGELDEAAHLYRRANPGGGACGTSVSSNWEAQVRGVIRCEERRRRCSAAIPERLLDLRSPPLGAYGVDRLKEAGFDLAALYRGALVTINRDADQAELARALAKAPASLRVQASKRLTERGPEAWEQRVFALEGLADVAGREALPVLISATRRGTRAVRLRAIDALGTLAAAPPYDPCSPDLHGGYGYGSSQWERHITDLGRSCNTVLSADESAALTTKLLPFTRDADPEIREAAARALGKIASSKAVPPLEKLLSDPYQVEGSRTCDSGPDNKLINCRVPFPVREAAKEALDHIEEIRSSRQKSPPQNI